MTRRERGGRTTGGGTPRPQARSEARPLAPHELWLAAAAAAVLGLVVFAAPLLLGESFFYRDVARQYLPVATQIGRALAHGELPLWNASTQGGVPLLANLHTGALYPPNLLHRVLPAAAAYAWLVWAHWVALVVGAYALLRRRIDAPAAGLAAAGLGLTGVVLCATSFLPYLAAAAWMPWALRSLDRRSARAWIAPGLALALAMQVLAGDPSIALMTVIACVAWILAVDGPRGALRALGVVALSELAAAALAAVQLAPAYALYRESVRATVERDVMLAWSFHPLRMLEWCVRLPFGGLREAPFFRAYGLAQGPDGQPFLLEHGWGLVALVGIVPGLVRRGPLRTAGLAIFALGAFLAFGRSLGASAAVLAQPPFSFFRFPERYGLLASLGALLVAANGLEALLGRRAWPAPRAAKVLLALAAAVALLALLPDSPASFAPAALRSGGLLAAVAIAWWALASRPAARLCAVALLCAVEGALAVRADVLTLPAAVITAAPERAAEVAASGERLWRDNAALRAWESPARGADTLATEQRTLVGTYASALPGRFGIDELGGYSPVGLERMVSVLRGVPRPLQWQLYAVGWVVTTVDRAAQFGLVPVRALPAHAGLYRTRARPVRAWIPRRVASVGTAQQAMDAMRAPGFDPYALALREPSPAPLPTDSLPGPATVTALPRESANRIELQVDNANPAAVVVVAESVAHGWTVRVDGAARPLETMDGTLLGVVVPRGHSRVTFAYREPWLLPGGLISLLAAALLAVLAWRGRGAVTSRTGA